MRMVPFLLVPSSFQYTHFLARFILTEMYYASIPHLIILKEQQCLSKIESSHSVRNTYSFTWSYKRIKTSTIIHHDNEMKNKCNVKMTSCFLRKSLNMLKVELIVDDIISLTLFLSHQFIFMNFMFDVAVYSNDNEIQKLVSEINNSSLVTILPQENKF